MVIRDLATETGIKMSQDTRPLETVLDELIEPDLALTLITMYAGHRMNRETLGAPSDIITVFLSTMAVGLSSIQTVTRQFCYPV